MHSGRIFMNTHTEYSITYRSLLRLYDKMVVFQGEGDDVPIRIFIRVPRGRVLDGGGGCHVHLLHHLGLANVPWSIEAVYQLKREEGKKKKKKKRKGM